MGGPDVCLGHAENLLIAGAKYPLDSVGMKMFSIPASGTVSDRENLFLRQLPKLLVLGFVDYDTIGGNYTENTFHFKHYNINVVAFCVASK